MSTGMERLEAQGLAWVRAGLADPDEAFRAARALVDASRASADLPALSLLGDFILPPADGPPSRDFQTLHFDFGLPLDPKLRRDVGRFTALHVPSDAAAIAAVTRLVPLQALLGQRPWPPHHTLVDRFVAYGGTHGAWNDDHGYVEGSLARVVEAAAGDAALPSVKADQGFLCGTEFDSLASELRFFERHLLSVEDVAIEVRLSPGGLLVFDNLALAHGRRGIRQPGELHQWVFGERDATAARQRELRDRALAAFGAVGGDEVAAQVVHARVEHPVRRELDAVDGRAASGPN